MITTNQIINFKSQLVPPCIPVVQGDTGRSIAFEMADYTIPAGATATYYVQKPSGHAVYNAAEITDGKIICNLTAQALAEVGENKLQIRVLKDEEVVTSFTVWLLVHPFEGEGAVESGTEMNIFDQAVEAAEEAIETAGAEATEAIERAGAAAAAEVAEGIDPTLTISGKAADAKVTGDAITSITETITALGLSVVDGMLCVTYTD